MAIACFRWLVGLSALMAIGHSQTPHGKDTNVCTSFTQPAGITNNVVKPNISNQFHCRVEIVIKNTNTTELVYEYFDSINKRGFVEQTYESLRFDAWYDYSTNEFIGFFPDAPVNTPGRCYVQDLSTSNQRFLFGYDNSQGKGHIFSAAGALHFGGQGVDEIYMGRAVIRDIQVDWWRSCQYWANMDATMIVDWYFTAQGSWDSAVGIRIPVTAHVQGESYLNGKYWFDHYYNFFDFRPYLDANEDKVFETPAGVQCPGRKLTRGFPSVPNDAFSFTTEILDTVNMQISLMKETFYYSQKLVMYEYRPQQGDYAPYGYNDLIEIHDFHTGVAYITDRAQGNCSFRQIESGDFNDRSSGPNTVRIRNSNEFFYFDVKNVSYEGVKQNRDIDCDTWVATRSDYPFKFPVNSTWEWYFATTEWTEVNPGPESGNIPVQMRIAFPDQGQNYQYNIFNFKKSKPDLLKFDISGCYQFGQRRKFQFSLNVPDTVKAKISTNKEVFKYYILQAVIAATGVSPIRVAKLQVFVADAVNVRFELLDIAPNIGDVINSPTYKGETPLDFAANTIASMIQNGQFVVTLGGDAFKNINPLVAQASSFVEITYNVPTTVQTQQQTDYGPESSVITMCDTSKYSGKIVSVYNPSNDILDSHHDTHHCFCHISSEASIIGITIYDYQLNCSANSQNLTLEDSNGIVLESQCNTLLRGYRNSSGENLTMTWYGETQSAGLFWIGFHAMSYDTNVTVDCQYLPDPTTTTTTTTTTTQSPLVPYSPNYTMNAVVSSNNTLVSSTQYSTIKTSAENQQSEPLSKTAIYALIGVGALLLVIVILLLVILYIVVRRRTALGDDRLVPRQSQNFQTEMKQRESENITLSSADNRRESKANVSNDRKQSNVYTNI